MPTPVSFLQAFLQAHCHVLLLCFCRGDAEGVGRGFLQALAATAVVSALLVGLLLTAPETLLGFFQTNAEVMPYAKTYCMIRWGGDGQEIGWKV